MNKQEFLTTINSFDTKEYDNTIKIYETLRSDFVKRFPINRILNMGIDEYVIGKHGQAMQENSFCYELERTLSPLGKIVGSPAKKFGIYYSPTQGSYIITKTWEKGSLQESFSALKQDIATLIEAGRKNHLEVIRSSKISPMFKGKILSTYFPNKYLSVFSEEHLDYFIHRLELDHLVSGNHDIFDKRNALLLFKNKQDYPAMNSWSLHKFAHFLYTKYPGRPAKGNVEMGDYYQEAEMIYGDFNSFDDDNNHKSTTRKNDYEELNKVKKQLGERGEYVVMRYETTKLAKLGIHKQPKQISLEDDSCGYDIRSYSEDGKPLYIEVKTTNLSPQHFHLYITGNELTAAKNYGSSYHVYIVFKPNSSKPKIFDMENPFIKKNKVKLIPVSYKINIEKI